MEIKLDAALEKRKNRIFKNFTRSTKDILLQLRNIEGYSKSIECFFNAMESVFINPCDDSNAKEHIGIYGTNMFDELIYAAGLKPVWLSGGSYAAGALADEHVPRDTDPVIRSTVGYEISELIPLYRNCSAVIIPSTTDGERKMTALLSKYLNVIPVDIPPVRYDMNSQKRFIEQMYQLKETLENISGRKISNKSLLEALKLVSEAEYEGKRLYEIKKHSPSVISGCHATMAINAYSYMNIKEWTRCSKILNDELEDRIKQKKFLAKDISPRILIAGSCIIFPNMKIPIIIEELGGVVVAEENMLSNRFMYNSADKNTSSINDTITSLCKKYYMNDTSSFFMFNSERLEKIKNMINDYKIDGVIYHVLKGDIICDFELNPLEKVLNELNIPLLRVETDYNPEDIEQLKIRTEAFIEMISAKKRRKGIV